MGKEGGKKEVHKKKEDALIKGLPANENIYGKKRRLVNHRDR